MSSVDVYGERQSCINVEFLEDKMANMGVHPAEIIMTLNGQNKTVYPVILIVGKNGFG